MINLFEMHLTASNYTLEELSRFRDLIDDYVDVYENNIIRRDNLTKEQHYLLSAFLVFSNILDVEITRRELIQTLGKYNENVDNYLREE